tara:strand:- start:629 stop:1372 length:744 start_codon:yes stop_codon:yes gene_type:complete
MATDDERRGIVQAGEIAFDTEGSDVEADELDQIVTGNHNAVSAGSSGISSYVLTNMGKLGDESVSLFVETYTHMNEGRLVGKKITSFFDIHKKLLPYVLHLVNDGNQTARISVGNCEPDILRNVLEAEFPEIENTGIYEATGLTGIEDVPILAMLKYIPELNVLTGLNNRIIDIVNNPFQALFAMPVIYRPFFTGVLVDAGNNSGISTQEEFHCPLGLREILNYARDVGQVKNVREYMDEYAEINKT